MEIRDDDNGKDKHNTKGPAVESSFCFHNHDNHLPAMWNGWFISWAMFSTKESLASGDTHNM